jgi:protoporphyrinogen oxidase
MAWMWARLKARTTRLGTFEGGFQSFADLVGEKLREMGVEIGWGRVSKFIKRNQAQGLSIDAGGIVDSFDKVLVTTSPNLMAKFCPICLKII